MAFSARRIRIVARIVAGVSLVVGLMNAFNAMGVSASLISPIEQYGEAAFAVLSVVALLRLFAAVGLWAHATWGAFLLLFASVLEMFIATSGLVDLMISPTGFAISILLLASSLGLLIWRSVNKHQHVNQL
ncbi:hypothetical protein [Maritalea sp.]|uniref:hypothetical protein n=1 Tax=Maritalea sp. TaxID=2003361 RepID=UPI003EF74476